jgi:hypothetical protein
LDMHETFKDHVRDQSNLLTQHVSQLQHEMRGQQEEWLIEHNNLQQEQGRKLQQQHEELQRLSEIIARTNKSILPWSVGLDSLASQVLKGYSLLKVFLYLIGVLQVIWLFTYPQRLRWLGYYLKRLAALGALLECGFLWANDGLWSIRKDQDVICDLRAVTFLLGYLVYLVGMVTSLFRCQDPKVVIPENIPSQATQESILARLESFETEWKRVRQQQRETENTISNVPMRSNDNINTKGTAAQSTSSNPEVCQAEPDGAHMSSNPVDIHHSTREHEHCNRLAANPNSATFPPARSNVVTPPLDRTFRPPAWNYPSYWNPPPMAPHGWGPMTMSRAHWASNSSIFSPSTNEQQTANMEDQAPSDSNSEEQDSMDQGEASHGGQGSSPSKIPSDVYMETRSKSIMRDQSRSMDREVIDTPPIDEPSESEDGDMQQDDDKTDTGSNESSLFFRKRPAVDMEEQEPLPKRFKKKGDDL